MPTVGCIRELTYTAGGVETVVDEFVDHGGFAHCLVAQ